VSRILPSSEQLEVLSEFSHAIGAARDTDDVLASSIRSIAELLPEAGTIGLFLTDRGGRLRLAAAAGERAETGRRRSARRRAVYSSGASSRVSAGPDETVSLVPLMVRGESLGLLEVTSPAEPADRAWATLLALASQTAVAVRGLHTAAHLEGAIEALEGSSVLAADLMLAESKVDAVRTGLRFCSARFGPPVAAWVSEDSPMHLSLRGVRGPRAIARRLRETLPSVPRWSVATEGQRAEVIRRFSHLASGDAVGAADAGDALILVGHVPPSLEAAVATVGRILAAALDHIGDREAATKRNMTLDTGLAITAHEVRAPLVGAKAAIEAVLRTNDIDEAGAELLGAATRELSELSGTLDGLLRWSVDQEPLRRRRIELVGVVREAVSTCNHHGQVAISASVDQVSLLADRAQLRSALGNVVRNALLHAPAGPVDVQIHRWDARARVSVRDHGPGVLAEERDGLFDPFVRGASAAGRSGRGLGLFITRRVIEAHGGMVWIDAAQPGVTVNMELPVVKVETG